MDEIIRSAQDTGGNLGVASGFGDPQQEDVGTGVTRSRSEPEITLDGFEFFQPDVVGENVFHHLVNGAAGPMRGGDNGSDVRRVRNAPYEHEGSRQLQGADGAVPSAAGMAVPLSMGTVRSAAGMAVPLSMGTVPSAAPLTLPENHDQNVVKELVALVSDPQIWHPDLVDECMCMDLTLEDALMRAHSSGGRPTVALHIMDQMVAKGKISGHARVPVETFEAYCAIRYGVWMMMDLDKEAAPDASVKNYRIKTYRKVMKLMLNMNEGQMVALLKERFDLPCNKFHTVLSTAHCEAILYYLFAQYQQIGSNRDINTANKARALRHADDARTVVEKYGKGVILGALNVRFESENALERAGSVYATQFPNLIGLNLRPSQPSLPSLPLSHQ
jgi:hypothetical protein